MSKISLQSTISINENRYIGSNIGEELMIMDLTTGNYININQVGTVIWEQIQQPQKVADICQFLLERFEVEQKKCERDTMDYLERMSEQGIVNID